MHYLSLFTGGGGLDMAVEVLWPNAVPTHLCENDPAASTVLRQKFPSVPNLGDASKVDWSSLPPVDMILGGYPCQPFSGAGKKEGIEDERNGWPWFFDAIRVLRPALVLAENVSGHIGLGLDATISDLASLGYDAGWGTVRASGIGAPHSRERLFLLAWDSSSERVEGLWTEGLEHAKEVVDAAISDSATARTSQVDPAWAEFAPMIARWERILDRDCPREVLTHNNKPTPEFLEWFMGWPAGWTDVPGVTVNDRIKILGNGVVPLQAVFAYKLLMERSAV